MKELDEIYRLYVNDVFRYLLRITQNPDLAEELTQDTFFKAVNQIHKFRGESSIKAWLLVIAKNSFYSHTRSARNKDLPLDDIGTDPESDDDLSASFEKKEDTRRLHRALHNLTEPYKEVFSLRVFGELSFREIAELFEKTESWAKVTFYRAKSKIAEKIKEENEQ